MTAVLAAPHLVTLARNANLSATPRRSGAGPGGSEARPSKHASRSILDAPQTAAPSRGLASRWFEPYVVRMAGNRHDEEPTGVVAGGAGWPLQRFRLLTAARPACARPQLPKEMPGIQGSTPDACSLDHESAD